MILVQKENLLVLFAVSYKTVVKDDWLETTKSQKQEPEIEQAIKHLKLSIAHFKACCNLFLVWAKTSSFNISHFSQSF